jgi:hypothetical protein
MANRSFSKQIDLHQIVFLPESICRLEMGRDEIDLIEIRIVELRFGSRNRKVWNRFFQDRFWDRIVIESTNYRQNTTVYRVSMQIDNDRSLIDAWKQV